MTSQAVNNEEPLHACSHPGCTKAYKRLDHLERHKTNHATPAHACYICWKTYHRADVLKRHLKQHEQGSPDSEGPTAKRPKVDDGNRKPDEGSSRNISTGGSSNDQDLPYEEQVQHNAASTQTSSEMLSPSTAYVPDDNYMLPQFDISAYPGDMMSTLFDDNIFASNALSGLDFLNDNAFDPNFWSLGTPQPSQTTLGEAFTAWPNEQPNPGLQLEDDRSAVDYSAVSLILTAQRRNDMLELIQDVKDVDLTSACMSLASLRKSFELFWLRFASLYQFIHRPSLAATSTEATPVLLLAIISIGNCFTEDQTGYHIAVAIHQRLRGKILELVEETVIPSTQALQAILLVNFFGRILSSLKHHDLSQIYHPSIIVMAKFANLFHAASASPQAIEHSRSQGSAQSTVEDWLRWATAEERKRVAWFCFTNDNMNAVLFKYPRNVNLNALSLSLPSSSALFDAPSLEEWRSSTAGSALSFKDALSILLARNQVSDQISDLGAWILLNSLLAVASELTRPTLSELPRIPPPLQTEWKKRLQASFDGWQCYADALQARRQEDGGVLYYCGTSLCCVGMIYLHVNIRDLRLYAGGRHIAGRPASEADRVQAKANLESWAVTPDADIATFYALRLLSRMFATSGSMFFELSPVTNAWCAYLATLTVLAYGCIREDAPLIPNETCVTLVDSTSLVIEPLLAQQAASQCINRLLACGDATKLSQAKRKNDVAGVLAMCLSKLRKMQSGIIAGPIYVLQTLLSNSLQSS